MTRRLSYGWVVLTAAFLIIPMAIGTLVALAVFLKPLEDSMGWKRSSISAIALMNWIAMGMGSFASGYLSDRFGTRRVVLCGGLLVGGGLILSGRGRRRAPSAMRDAPRSSRLTREGVSC